MLSPLCRTSSVLARHCLHCNKCIKGYDRHSDVFNNCIGAANYHWYVACVVLAFCLLLMVLSVSLALNSFQFTDHLKGNVLAAHKYREF